MARQTRPVYNRLPVQGYQDNPIADALTQFYDSKLVAVGEQAEQLYTKLDPATTPPDYLDWLAYLVGMVAPYYSVSWAVPVKRKAIELAYEIFSHRGTFKGLDLALSIHGFDFQIFATTDLIFPFVFTPSTRFGSASDTVFIRLPLKYSRSSAEFREAERAVKNYTAIVTPTQVCYDQFYLGFSLFGDPVFSQ